MLTARWTTSGTGEIIVCKKARLAGYVVVIVMVLMRGCVVDGQGKKRRRVGVKGLIGET